MSLEGRRAAAGVARRLPGTGALAGGVPEGSGGQPLLGSAWASLKEACQVVQRGAETGRVVRGGDAVGHTVGGDHHAVHHGH